MRFDPSGGFRWLDAYIMASVVQLATHKFCRRFLTRRLDPCGRQYDQMTQAARSGKENIIEGSERASTSKETEMKLTDVARASLGELRGDYETWLLQHERVPWKVSSPESQEIFSLRLDRPNYAKDEVAHDCCAHILAQYRKFTRWLDSDDSFICANAQLILISRTLNMLGSLLKAQGERFAHTGGFREQLTATRVATRAVQENAPDCPECGKPMQKRRAKAGPTPGREFWGCTGYPECRGIREIQ